MVCGASCCIRSPFLSQLQSSLSYVQCLDESATVEKLVFGHSFEHAVPLFFLITLK